MINWSLPISTFGLLFSVLPCALVSPTMCSALLVLLMVAPHSGYKTTHALAFPWVTSIYGNAAPKRVTFYCGISELTWPCPQWQYLLSQHVMKTWIQIRTWTWWCDLHFKLCCKPKRGQLPWTSVSFIAKANLSSVPVLVYLRIGALSLLSSVSTNRTISHKL